MFWKLNNCDAYQLCQVLWALTKGIVDLGESKNPISCTKWSFCENYCSAFFSYCFVLQRMTSRYSLSFLCIKMEKPLYVPVDTRRRFNVVSTLKRRHVSTDNFLKNISHSNCEKYASLNVFFKKFWPNIFECKNIFVSKDSKNVLCY